MGRKTVILAAGDFPRVKTDARRLLEGAARVVCCDGAADAYRRKMRREPTVVVGDGDSLAGTFGNVVRVADQESNDLEKAIRLCASEGWKDPVVLGATGKREDHTLGNVFIAMEHGLEVYTNYGRFLPIVGNVTIRTRLGAAVSVFANPGTRMRSSGLAWPLDGVAFDSFHRATLNRSNARRVALWSSGKAYVYLAFV